MVKNKIVKGQLEQRNLLKGCYGTAEWSKNSGICCQCKWKNDCGNANSRRLEN